MSSSPPPKGRPSAVPGLLIAAFFGLVGLVFTGTGAADLLSRRAFVARAARTSGTVVRVEKASRFNELQVVTFSARAPGRAETRTVEFRSSPARIPAHPGDSVPVLYDPADPGRAEIARYEELWHDAVIRAGIGAALLLLAGGLTTSALRRRNR